MEKLRASIIIEILGRPPEHVKEALNTLITKLGTEKGVKLLDKTYHEPIPVESSKDLFTAFAEVMLELDNLTDFFSVIFAYMPSNIDFIQPEKLVLTNIELNELANKITARLHEYDAITKNSLVEREIIAKKLYEVAPHFFKKPAEVEGQTEKKEPEKEEKPEEKPKAKKEKKKKSE